MPSVGARLTTNTNPAGAATDGDSPASLAPADSVNDAALPVREKLYTHVPEYVFALYRQVVDSMLPTQREAYMASLLSSVPALDGKPPGDPQVNFQEYGCCFTLFFFWKISLRVVVWLWLNARTESTSL